MIIREFARRIYLFSIFIIINLCSLAVDSNEHDRNVFNQHLPNCLTGYDRITTKSSAKAILCPMIRDEEGFLSEWVAYYQMHGFSHIILFDDGSTDNSFQEVNPWINSGFVSIRLRSTLHFHAYILYFKVVTCISSNRQEELDAAKS